MSDYEIKKEALGQFRELKKTINKMDDLDFCIKYLESCYDHIRILYRGGTDIEFMCGNMHLIIDIKDNNNFELRDYIDLYKPKPGWIGMFTEKTLMLDIDNDLS